MTVHRHPLCSTIGLLGALAPWIVASMARAECVDCHAIRPEQRLRAPVALVAGDVHGTHGRSCGACHGGDEREPTMRAHDPARGFRGVARGLAAVLLCGGCHEAIAREVRAGSHGRALEHGRFAASCTDCHGAHGIRAAPDPVAVCTGCHADARRMAASGLATDQTRQWRASVHGLLRATGDERAPACASCHEPHRAAAGLAAVSACARCHPSMRSAFDRGPHAPRFRALGFLDCVECHGSHEVRAADATMLRGVTAVCARCHGEGTEAFARVRALADQAAGIEAARALPRDDPRRARAIGALHALDARGLSRAIAALPRARARRPPPAAPRGWRMSDLIWVLFAVLALALLVLGYRSWRRR